MLKLQFRDRRQEAVWLVDQKFTIGKNPSNSLMIDDETICDFHAEISNTSDQLSILNKSSSPSLWVNNKLVEKLTMLNAEDVIKLGRIELELIDPKALLNKTKAKKFVDTNLSSGWVIHSKASWLDQKTFPIDSKVVIGRDPECDITLRLEHLSRKHLELEVRGGHLYIKDLGSSNGTFLNGQKITESEIKPGDKIKLDVLTFEVSGPSHDSNKTIIRSAPARPLAPTNKPAAPTQKKPVAEANKEAIAKKKSISTKQSSKSAPTKKRLASNGKQDWIPDKPSTKEAKKSKTAYILLAATVIILGITGAYFAF
jgi:pSer/pThr/pTyr-binding forkhead associated (FHA) protein